MRIRTLFAGSVALLAAAAQPVAAQTAGPAAEQPRGPVPALSTGTLAALCGATGDDADSLRAVGYCRGVFVGMGQYHSIMTAPGRLRPIFCLPEPSPTLEGMQAAFVAWASANPERLSERAAEGVLRFAAESYPCAAPAPARRR